MAKFNLDDMTQASSGPKQSSGKKSFGNKTKATIVYEDDTLRVMQRGEGWTEFVIYNYKQFPPNCGPGTENPDIRYGRLFSNQQMAQRGFAAMKTNLTTTVAI